MTTTPTLGLHRGMSFADYRAIDAVNKSACGTWLQTGSMAAVRHAMLNRTGATAAQRKGTLIHAALLEPDTIDGRLVIGGPKKTVNAGKPNERTWELSPGSGEFAEWAAALEAEGKVGVHTEEWASIEGACAAVKAHPAASDLILSPGAYREATMLWQTRVSLVQGTPVDVLCKGRPDVIRPDRRMEVDVKVTSRPLTESGMRSLVANWGYYVQGGTYIDGLQRCFDTSEPWDFVMVFVPDEEPYTPVVRRLHPEWLKAGLERWMRFLHEYAQCLSVDIWPGPDGHWTADNEGREPVYPTADSIPTLSAPDWIAGRKSPLEVTDDEIVF